jgi:prophage antirepressor-like protein
MSEIVQVTEAIFGDTPLRTGYSEDAGASYVVAADIKGALKHGGNMNSFLRGLEKSQESAGQTEGVLIKSPLYVGTETIQTAGGPQRMKVVYKRGVFQLLMLSRRPEATEFRDRVFDVLETIERDGFYIKKDATLQQLEAANERMQATIAKQRRQMEAGAQRINAYIQEADRAVQEAQRAKVDEHDALYRKIAVLDHWRQLTLMRMRRAGVEAHTLKQAENDLKSVGRL